MPLSKRVFLFTVRVIILIGALSFLILYVWRAQGKQNALFSSSKNLRTVYSSGGPTMNQAFLELSPNDPAPAASPVPPPSASTLPTFHTSPDPFQIGLSPERPVMMGGSKSMSLPVVEVISPMRIWTLPPDNFFHTFGPPVSGKTAPDVRFGEPSIQVRVDEIENGTKASPASPTSDEEPPASAPSPSPTEP